MKNGLMMSAFWWVQRRSTMADLVDGGYGFLVPSVYSSLLPVGRGAFGLVVRATIADGAVREDNAYFAQRETSQAAIKKLPGTTVFKDGYHAKQVYREITLLKQLQHDNLINLLDLYISPSNDIYIVTEALDCDLSTLIQGVFRFEENHIKFIVYQILRGLKYMHSAGVSSCCGDFSRIGARFTLDSFFRFFTATSSRRTYSSTKAWMFVSATLGSPVPRLLLARPLVT